MDLDAQVCITCSRGGDDEQMLLCDGCPAAFHMYCLSPPLPAIPEGDWFCEECERLGARAVQLTEAEAIRVAKAWYEEESIFGTQYNLVMLPQSASCSGSREWSLTYKTRPGSGGPHCVSVQYQLARMDQQWVWSAALFKEMTTQHTSGGKKAKRAAVRPPAGWAPSAGDRVMAMFSDDKVYGATVVGVNPHRGTYTIDWDDGYKRLRVRKADQIFPCSSSSSVTATSAAVAQPAAKKSRNSKLQGPPPPAPASSRLRAGDVESISDCKRATGSGRWLFRVRWSQGRGPTWDHADSFDRPAEVTRLCQPLVEQVEAVASRYARLRRRARHLPVTVAGVDTHGASIMCPNGRMRRHRRGAHPRPPSVPMHRVVCTSFCVGFVLQINSFPVLRGVAGCQRRRSGWCCRHCGRRGGAASRLQPSARQSWRTSSWPEHCSRVSQNPVAPN
jgi:hypothetical protein|eukprot:COSAG01_NODE_5014_length_4542_cov_4.834121_2_plen_446_part_00